MASNTPEFDVDDSACSDLNRLAGIICRMDGLIETNRGLDAPLQSTVIDDVLIVKRLLDHHQIELVQLPE